MYICLKCTKFLKINAGNSLTERTSVNWSRQQTTEDYTGWLECV